MRRGIAALLPEARTSAAASSRRSWTNSAFASGMSCAIGAFHERSDEVLDRVRLVHQRRVAGMREDLYPHRGCGATNGSHCAPGDEVTPPADDHRERGSEVAPLCRGYPFRARRAAGRELPLTGKEDIKCRRLRQL